MKYTWWGVAALMAACGGGRATPAEQPPSSGEEYTVRIGSSGVSPANVSLSAGEAVTFINDDASPHQIASAPHPAHTDCPELNGPVLRNGERFTAVMTGNRATCGFHDHLNPFDARFQGTINVSATEEGGETY